MFRYIKLLIILLLKPCFLIPQAKTTYYKNLSSKIGVSAVSDKTLSAKTYSFNYPVYKIITDAPSDQLIISVRQKDVTGKLYTNKGYHLIIKGNDSIVGINEDSKLDLNLFCGLLASVRSASALRAFASALFFSFCCCSS